MYRSFGHGQILILDQSSRTKNILNPKIIVDKDPIQGTTKDDVSSRSYDDSILYMRCYRSIGQKRMTLWARINK